MGGIPKINFGLQQQYINHSPFSLLALSRSHNHVPIFACTAFWNLHKALLFSSPPAADTDWPESCTLCVIGQISTTCYFKLYWQEMIVVVNSGLCIAASGLSNPPALECFSSSSKTRWPFIISGFSRLLFRYKLIKDFKVIHTLAVDTK